jgi:hypothetical protein
MAAIPNILDISGNPLVIGNRYYVIVKQKPNETNAEYNQRKLDYGPKGNYRIIDIELNNNEYSALGINASGDEFYFKRTLFDFSPPTTGGRRKSRRIRKRFRRTRK